MAAGGFGLGAAQIGGEPARGYNLQKLDWFEGRGGSLLGFDRADGHLVYAIYPGDRATDRERSWLHLVLSVFSVKPLRPARKKHQAAV